MQTINMQSIEVHAATKRNPEYLLLGRKEYRKLSQFLNKKEGSPIDYPDKVETVFGVLEIIIYPKDDNLVLVVSNIEDEFRNIIDREG